MNVFVRAETVHKIAYPGVLRSQIRLQSVEFSCII